MRYGGAAGNTVDPIEIETEPYEQTNILELIQTENRLFNKVMKVFAWLCDEALLLESIVSSKLVVLSARHV